MLNFGRLSAFLTSASIPQPKILSRSMMISDLNIRVKSSFKQFSILPRIGIIAWNDASLACTQAPLAESPSTIHSSRSNGFFERQSLNFLGLLPTPVMLLLISAMTFLLTFSDSSRATLFASTSAATASAPALSTLIQLES